MLVPTSKILFSLVVAFLLFATGWALFTMYQFPAASKSAIIPNSLDFDLSMNISPWFKSHNIEPSDLLSESTAEQLESQSQTPAEDSRTLGIASHVFVISLARRKDRRSRMEVLRNSLNVSWEYVDALDKDDDRVTRIMESVRRQRSIDGTLRTLSWPTDQDTFDFMGPRLIDYWALDVHVSCGSLGEDKCSNQSSEPLLCAVGENVIPEYEDISNAPYHLILSKGMIACWYSHLSVIRRVAESSASNVYMHERDGQQSNQAISAIIFEDDIDIEWDIHHRLTSMWPQLPINWDIVMLGHCWSDESYNPPLSEGSPLHLSHAPKCTHAYALSPHGAKKLLTYLSYPPFAYSRALDQAIAYLIASRRLNSYSVVPSIVVQRKNFDINGLLASDAEEEDGDGYVGDSDIWVGEKNKGSAWLDTLLDSTLVRAAKMAIYNTD